MPIEIRELIIKTTVEKSIGSAATHTADTNALRKELLAACREMIKKTLKETKER